jgi:alpha-1,2-mannosyltransferase
VTAAAQPDRAGQQTGRAGEGPAGSSNRIDNWLLLAGVVAMCAVVTWYVHLARASPGMWSLPVDLQVYRDAGLIARHVHPFYDPHLGSPLYDWPGPPGLPGIKFIYPPFAALPFAVIPAHLTLLRLEQLASAVNILAVVVAAVVTVRALGRERGLTGKRGLGLVLLVTAIALMTEPVQRTIYLGQVELVLMALVLWDVCQPDDRWWKGAGVGIAAGVKLVPLIFIPYLLLTRRFRAAAVAAGTFAVTVGLGFIVLPTDSSRWWLQGLFLRGSYQGNISWGGDQSLLALIERLGGTGAHGIWLAAAVIIAILGLGAAAVLDRHGHRVLGVAACALTGVIISPISWDHHWVWVLMAAPLFLYYGLTARGWARWACFAAGAVVMAIYGAWATTLWGQKDLLAGWDRGFIWAAPTGNNREMTWHGWQVISGNAYLLTGLALFVLLIGTAARLVLTRTPRAVAPSGSRVRSPSRTASGPLTSRPTTQRERVGASRLATRRLRDGRRAVARSVPRGLAVAAAAAVSDWRSSHGHATSQPAGRAASASAAGRYRRSPLIGAYGLAGRSGLAGHPAPQGGGALGFGLARRSPLGYRHQPGLDHLQPGEERGDFLAVAERLLFVHELAEPVVCLRPGSRRHNVGGQARNGQVAA